MLHVVLLQLGTEFVNLLVDLVPDILALLPVETHIACLVLNAVGLDERRQGLGHTGEHGLVAVLLLLLDLFPKQTDLASRLRLCLAIDMGVAEDEFVAQFVADVGNVEIALLAAYLGIEDNVQKHIAKFLAYLVGVLFDEGIAQFESLLYGVWAQALKGLLAVPGALLSEGVHHIQQTTESGQFLFFC